MLSNEVYYHYGSNLLRMKRMVYRRHGKSHRMNGPCGLWEDGDIYYCKYDGPRIWN